MSTEEISHVFRVVSAVLWLGQLDFKAKGDASEIKVRSTLLFRVHADSRLIHSPYTQDMSPVKTAAQLLGCDAKLLEVAMVRLRPCCLAH